MKSVSNMVRPLATRKSYSEGSNDKVLVIGPRRIKVNSITNKIIKDIEFLHDRIDKTKRIKSQNSTILSTYQEMLASRESILEWLREIEPSEFNSSTSEKAAEVEALVSHSESALK